MKNNRQESIKNKMGKKEIRNARKFKKQLNEAYDEMFPDEILGGGNYK
jgi:hypothetical protein